MGFSFRDEHLRKLIVRAARTNPTLQIIVFCYSLADRAAYEKLIPELDVPNGNILYVTPPPPATMPTMMMWFISIWILLSRNTLHPSSQSPHAARTGRSSSSSRPTTAGQRD